VYYVLTLFVGILTGAVCVGLYIVEWYAKVKKREELASVQARQAAHSISLLDANRQEIDRARSNLEAQKAAFEKRVIGYEELQTENAILKKDLQNIDISVNKLNLDGELRSDRQKELERKSREVARRYLSETVKAVGVALTPSNFAICKQRLLDVIHRVREIGFEVSENEEAGLIADLRRDFELAVRAAYEREEQARIKARIREEEKLQREIDREVAQNERERIAIKTALDRALAEAGGRHSEEIERLQARLLEAEEKSRRTLSMAQQTKAGNVYVISNIGSFGDGVFKVGMTRRLEPMDRIQELCSASVPFPFDVHMMIRCDDAPSLETALHRELQKSQINKVNPRKEFFRTDIETISRIVRKHHGEVEYTADAEALQYKQSLTMGEADANYISSVYDKIEEEAGVSTDEV
jgi:hypothetical protein